jgi:hypothetical protein
MLRQLQKKGLLFVEFSNEERRTPCQWFVEAAFSSAPALEAGPSQYKHPLFSGKSFTTFIDSFRLTPKIANIFFLKKRPLLMKNENALKKLMQKLTC